VFPLKERVPPSRLLRILKGEFEDILLRKGLFGRRLDVERLDDAGQEANWDLVIVPPIPDDISVTRYIRKRLRHLMQRYDLD
jgi:hypothetical protein